MISDMKYKNRSLQEYRRCAALKNGISGSETFGYLMHVVKDIQCGVSDWNHFKYDLKVYFRNIKYRPQFERGPFFFNMEYSPEKEYRPQFSLRYYVKMCDRFAKDERFKLINMEQYIDGDFDKCRFNVVLRHDIDTKFCLEKIKQFSYVEKEHGLTSSIYVICDGSRYRPAEACKMVEEVRQNGSLVGLHTLAHGNNNPKKYLEFEINEFEQNFGFKPTTYVMHGLNPRPVNYRKNLINFKKSAAEIEKELNIKGHRSHGFGEAKFAEQNVLVEGGSQVVIPTSASELLNRTYLGSPIMVVTHPWMWDVTLN